ncbi:MAG: glycoside hydrolase family 57 protein [Paludibacteraceae bacterium]|nr:glycoside hydrolase family 57 protein [Paludibacteraceae bacterium]
MRNICFVFHVHEPFRLKRYRFFDIGQDHYYYDDFQTEGRIANLVEQSYLPANRTLLEMIKSSNGKFRCAFAISGVAMEQMELYAPELIDSFKALADTKCVEFLAVPYSYSLAAMYDFDEWENQLNLHAEKIQNLFGLKPTTLFNTELLYSDEIGEHALKLGYKTILTEGSRLVLGWKSSDYLYHSSVNPRLKILMRNPKLSDDIAFRFSDYSWKDYPLDAEKYVSWISGIQDDSPIVNLWMGYETFGLRQTSSTGIFDFLKAIPYFAMEQGMGFMTPSEAGKKLTSVDAVVSPYPLLWTGEAKDLSTFTGNDLQQEALRKLYAVAERVRLCQDKSLKHDWQLLQSIDHFRYMNHIDAAGTNYESAYDAFVNYMNVLADFLERVEEQYPTTIDNEELNELLKTINNQEKEIVQLEKEIRTLRSRPKKEAPAAAAEPVAEAPVKKKKTAAKKQK